jgi:predicted SAM-dependent methyltransferase
MSMAAEPLRLHIGGTEPRRGWKILNIIPGPHVDYVGDCTDLSQFATDSVETVYASHVFEHLGITDFARVLAEVRRILQVDGRLFVSVPDLEVLCRLMLSRELSVNDKWTVMRMMFGGQSDPYDFHKIGLTRDFLLAALAQAGFREIKLVQSFGLFSDGSTMVFQGTPISLNMIAK